LPTPSASSAPDEDGAAATADVIAQHLAAPWGLAFLPDGTGVVTERQNGTIVHVGPPERGGLFTVTPIVKITGIDPAGDGGLLGIALSPKVATDRTAYVYYSTATDNRIGTISLPASIVTAPSPQPSSGASTPSANSASPGGASPSGSTPLGGVPSLGPAPSPTPASPAPPTAQTPHPIVTGIPHADTDNGGWLAFAPDGTLYASTGDAARPALSHNPASLAGKILRMTPAGKPVPGTTSLVFATGTHNVQGFAWDPGNHMYGVDASASTDGVLALRTGGDYGWPAAGNGAGQESTIAPIETIPAAQGGCAGVAMVANVLAIACLTGERLWFLQLTGNGTVFGAPQDSLVKASGRLRTVVAAPDGSLWITTSNTDGHGTPAPADDRIIQIVVADAGAGKS
jgi:glucose/arabinose dehydrogenase